MIVFNLCLEINRLRDGNMVESPPSPFDTLGDDATTLPVIHLFSSRGSVLWVRGLIAGRVWE